MSRSHLVRKSKLRSQKAEKWKLLHQINTTSRGLNNHDGSTVEKERAGHQEILPEKCPHFESNHVGCGVPLYQWCCL